MTAQNIWPDLRGRTLVEHVHPADMIQAKADQDMNFRLTAEGLPRILGNDYERHLHARFLRLQGRTKEEIRQALIVLGLEDIPVNKRESYVGDIINSIIVGFEK